MKFAIVIVFGFFAVAFANNVVHPTQTDLDSLSQGASSFQTGLFEKVSQASEDFVRTITSPFFAAQKKSKEILDRAYKRIDHAHTKAEGSFKALINNIENKLNHVEKKCADNLRPQYQKLKNEVLVHLQQYAEEKKNELKAQENPVEQQLEEIDERVEEFRLVAVTCFHFNPVVTTECVFNKISEYSNIIGEIGTTFNKAVTDATTNSITVQRDIVTHNSDIIRNVVMQLSALSKAIDACPVPPVTKKP